MTKQDLNPIDLAKRTLGCNQTEFANLMGVSTGLVSMWKVRGYITQRYLAKACEAVSYTHLTLPTNSLV